MKSFVALVLIVALFGIASSKHACEKAPSFVDPWVTKNFDIKLMDGTFYELAYHDYTQPRMCGCERSVKVVDTTVVPNTIHDQFSLQCGGKDQSVKLFFNNTDVPGQLTGKCSFFGGAGVCPDFVIDVGTRTAGEPYPWVLEFQCVEHQNNGKLQFAGINMYSRNKDEKSLNEMIESAKNHGLQPFIDGGFPKGLKIVNHDKCTYPEKNSS